MAYRFDLLPAYDDLKRMSDEEVAARYTQNASSGDRTGKQNVNPLALELMWMNGSFYLDELSRRDAARTNARMERMTATITRLTWTITVLTIVAVFAAIVAAVFAGLALRH